MRYVSYMGHDTIYCDILLYDAHCGISLVHLKCKNRPEIHVAVYDVRSPNTSCHIILIVQQTN